MKTIAAFLGIATGLVLGGCYSSPRTAYHYADPADRVIGEDFEYYPADEVYYSRGERIYVFREGPRWVRRSAPPHGWRRGSPSVRVHFRDGPEYHHEEVIGRYPRSWRPPRDSRDITIGR
jgi:hypothetical protein